MISEIPGAAWTIAGSALAVILGWIGTMLVKRMREPTRVESLWDRVDKQDAKIEKQGTTIDDLKATVEASARKASAAGRVIRDLARQWPERHVPRLNPADLAELDEDTIPTDHPWRVRP